MEARSRGVSNSDSDRLNELALRSKGEVKPEKVIRMARPRFEINPADVEISKLREIGQEVPKELI